MQIHLNRATRHNHSCQIRYLSKKCCQTPSKSAYILCYIRVTGPDTDPVLEMRSDPDPLYRILSDSDQVFSIWSEQV